MIGHFYLSTHNHSVTLINYKWTSKWLSSAGVRGKGKSEYIVIFVQSLTARLLSKIPKEFKGIAVKTKRKAIAKSM